MCLASDSPSLPGDLSNLARLAWIDEIEAAVWVVDGDGLLRHANARSEALMGIDRARLGSPCHEVIRGRDEHGGVLCQQHCHLRQSVSEGRQVPPALMQRTMDGTDQFLLVVPIPVSTASISPHGSPGSGPTGIPLRSWLVHIAIDATRYCRSTSFLETIAGRGAQDARAALERLTTREHEILSLLTEGEDVKRIAFRLGLSHATVRNHVQHILEKLGAHSMLEAIALDLLRATVTGAPEAPPSRGI